MEKSVKKDKGISDGDEKGREVNEEKRNSEGRSKLMKRIKLR